MFDKHYRQEQTRKQQPKESKEAAMLFVRPAAFPITSTILSAVVVSLLLSLANGAYEVKDLCKTSFGNPKTGKLETTSETLSDSDLFNDAYDIAESAKTVKYEVNCGAKQCVRSCQLDGVAASKSKDRGEACADNKDIKVDFDMENIRKSQTTLKCTLTCRFDKTAELVCNPQAKSDGTVKRPATKKTTLP